MMSKPIIRKLYFLLFALLQVIGLYAQTPAEIENQIEFYFEQLQSASTDKPSSGVKRSAIYESMDFIDCIIANRAAGEATCRVYEFSQKLDLMRKLYLLYTKNDEKLVCNLLDSSGNKIYDLFLHSCGRNRMTNHVLINQGAVTDLFESYEKWYETIREMGVEKAREANIYPDSFSRCKWIKELGYLSEAKNRSGILERYLEIKSDSSYLDYFLSEHGIYRYYKGQSSHDIINEMMILTLINTGNSFTPDILVFKLQGKEEDINEIAKQLETDRNVYQLEDRLREKNIVIILNK